MKSVDAASTVIFSAFVLLISFLPSLDGVFSFPSQRLQSKDVLFNDLPTEQRSQSEQIQHVPSSSPHHPWTHPPICTPHLPALSSPLCIYTLDTFNNDTGISIFTTPSIASSFAILPIITNPSLTLVTSPYSNGAELPYRLTPIPGKGHGLLATRAIPRLTNIMTTHPVLMARTEMVLSTPEREHYLRLALSQLPESTQKSYYDLVRLYNLEDFAAQDVVRANSFEIGLPSPASHSRGKLNGSTADAAETHTVRNNDGSSTVMHLSIHPEAARLNHACNPNAMYYLDPETLTHVVHATRDIQSGEEITVSYIGVMQSLSSRRKMLKEGFGFDCGCERCVMEEERQKGADGEEEVGQGMLGRIRSYEAWLKLVALGEVPTGWEGVDIQASQVEEILAKYLNLLEEEGLEGFMDDAYKLAAAAEWTFSREGKAREYGKRASEAMGVRYGPSHGDVERWRNIDEEMVRAYIEGLRGD